MECLAGSEADSSGIVGCRDLSLYQMVQFIQCHGAGLESRCFTALCVEDDAREVCDVRTERISDTTVGAWIKRRGDWDRVCATDSLCHYQGTERSLHPCFKVAGYERDLDEILGALLSAVLPGWPPDLVELTESAHPYNSSQLGAGWQYSALDVDLERRMYIHNRGVLVE